MLLVHAIYRNMLGCCPRHAFFIILPKVIREKHAWKAKLTVFAKRNSDMEREGLGNPTITRWELH